MFAEQINAWGSGQTERLGVAGWVRERGFSTELGGQGEQVARGHPSWTEQGP